MAKNNTSTTPAKPAEAPKPDPVASAETSPAQGNPVDNTDALRIAELERIIELQDQQLKAADGVIKGIERARDEAIARADTAEKKLKLAKSAPTGDVVFLGGKTWPIKGTVQAKFALDEVKKGHIFEDATLLIIDRPEE